MVGRFFRNNDKLGFILLPVAALALWSFSLILPPFRTIAFTNSFLFGFIGPYFSSSFWITINLFTSIGGAYLISFLCSKQEITDKQNLLPGFLFLVFSGLLNLNGAYHPLLIANLMLLAAFFLLFGTYREELSLSAIFDASFLISCSALIYSPLLIFVPVPFVCLLILKPFKLREWLLVLLGLALPFVLSITLLYLFNKPIDQLLQLMQHTFVPAHGFVFAKGSFLIHSAVVLLLLLGVYNSIFRSGNFKIKTQKVKTVLVWIMLLGIGCTIFVNDTHFFKGVFILIPLSIFVGDYLGNIKKSTLREFLTLLLLAAYVCSNLQAAGYL